MDQDDERRLTMGLSPITSASFLATMRRRPIPPTTTSLWLALDFMGCG